MTTQIHSLSMKCDVPDCPGRSPAYGSHEALREATDADGWTHDHLMDYCPNADIHATIWQQMRDTVRAAYPELVRD